MEEYSKHLTILDGLANSRRAATEGGHHDTATVLDAHIMKLEMEMNDVLAEKGDNIPPAEDGSPWWVGNSDYPELTWWWKETAAMHRLQERTEHRKEASLNALVKLVDKNYKDMKRDLDEETDEDMPEMSEALIEYLKHETAAHAIEQLNLYLADLENEERINLRVIRELDFVLRWKEIRDAEEEDTDEVDVKTIYPTHRELLVEDAIRALRDYRQALISYGSECEDKAAFERILEIFHRDDHLPKLVSTVPAPVASSKDSCSCGDECFIGSLPPRPSPPETPDQELEDQELVERLKQFDSEVREWSTYLQQELRSYRHYLSAGGQFIQDVVKIAKDIVALAKGKARSDQEDIEHFISRGCMGSCEQIAVEEGDAEIEDKALKIQKYNKERFEGLSDDLTVFYDTVSKDLHGTGIDRPLLKSAQMLLEMVENTDSRNETGEHDTDAAEIKPEMNLQTATKILSPEDAAKIIKPSTGLVEQANEIEKATLEVRGEVDSELVVASERVTALMKESADAGHGSQDDTKLVKEANKLVVLAKEEIQHPSKDLTSAPEPVKKEKRKKTVRFAHKLVEILGDVTPSSSKKK